MLVGKEQIMAKTEIIAEPGVQTIEIMREFDASPELVFRAHTEPDLLLQWLGPRQYTMRIDRYEVRDGGTWRYVHQDADGTEYGFHGVFHGTPSVDGIVQTFEFEGAPGHVSLERLTFEPLDGGNRTRIRNLAVYQSVAARDAMIESGMEEGLTEGYDRLDALLAMETAVR
jgi:uncharacterized protein YndB with AHSA1/START domain